MFGVETILVGVLAAYVVGVSKTGLPGAGIIAIPLFATVFEGRLIPGGTLPVLIVADLFAVAWYRHHTRWDLLRPLALWLAAGFAGGVTFFVLAGSETRPIEVVIGVIVLFVVGLQLVRLLRGAPDRDANAATAAIYGSTGGFTTFVANAAGPIINTYLVGLRLPKDQYLGTSAWFYFGVNVSKIPIYLALGEWTDGGRFFTGESLAFAAVIIPAVFAGVYSGRWVVHRIPERAFLVIILVLSAAGAWNLIL